MAIAAWVVIPHPITSQSGGVHAHSPTPADDDVPRWMLCSSRTSFRTSPIWACRSSRRAARSRSGQRGVLGPRPRRARRGSSSAWVCRSSTVTLPATRASRQTVSSDRRCSPRLRAAIAAMRPSTRWCSLSSRSSAGSIPLLFVPALVRPSVHRRPRSQRRRSRRLLCLLLLLLSVGGASGAPLRPGRAAVVPVL